MATNAAMPEEAIIASTPDQPVGKVRVESLDLIRGLAVMGIVLANLNSFASWPLEHQWPTVNGPLSVGEEAVWMIEYLFVDGKLRGLFSLLFGAGMVIFMERARAREAPAVQLQLRRLFWLMIFGLLHFFLLFSGDILHNYAVAGLLALLFIRIPAKWLFAGALLVLLANAIPSTQQLWNYAQYERTALTAPADAEVRREYEGEIAAERVDNFAHGELLANGSFAEIVKGKWERHAIEMWQHPQYWLFEYLTLMLMGAALFRMGFFSGAWDRRKMLLWGSAGIAASALVSAWLGTMAIQAGHSRAMNMFVFYGPVYLVRTPMILGYAAVLVATAAAIQRTGLGERIAAAGRMAFTNYIGTSLIMALIFQGWGLGLLAQFDKVERLPFLLFVWALMLLWSKPWLEHYRFGPLEWLWRCLTYWKLFPLRRQTAA